MFRRAIAEFMQESGGAEVGEAEIQTKLSAITFQHPYTEGNFQQLALPIPCPANVMRASHVPEGQDHGWADQLMCCLTRQEVAKSTVRQCPPGLATLLQRARNCIAYIQRDSAIQQELSAVGQVPSLPLGCQSALLDGRSFPLVLLWQTQETYNVPSAQRTLKLDTEIWTFTLAGNFRMLDRLLENRGPLNELAVKDTVNPDVWLTDSDWYEADCVVAVFRPMDDAIGILTYPCHPRRAVKNDHVPASFILPLITRLQQKLAPSVPIKLTTVSGPLVESGLPPVARTLRARLRHEVDDQWTRAIAHVPLTFYSQTCLVDPRFKTLDFLTAKQRNEAWRALQQSMEEMSGEGHHGAEEARPPPSLGPLPSLQPVVEAALAADEEGDLGVAQSLMLLRRHPSTLDMSARALGFLFDDAPPLDDLLEGLTQDAGPELPELQVRRRLGRTARRSAPCRTSTKCRTRSTPLRAKSPGRTIILLGSGRDFVYRA
jgi:hypothetical protein